MNDNTLPTIETLVSRFPLTCLTISQPYASLIASGETWVENRSWMTPYRGPLGIHAGQGTQYLTRSEMQNYPTKQIVAVAYMAGCINLKRAVDNVTSELVILKQLGITRGELLMHEHTEGPWCWILQRVRPCVPVPFSGSQGLWLLRNPPATQSARG